MQHFGLVQTHNFTPRHAGAWAAGGAFSLQGMSSLYAQRLMASTIRITKMIDDQFYSGKTQVFWVCSVLLQHRIITHRTEINEVHGWRLGAIIHRLKNEYGWSIQAEYRAPRNIAHYSLKAEIDRATLRFPPSARSLAKQEAAQ
jgi:hypothetical protein